ncbi:hypothetical protein GALL_295630 [mine drainage metagenome]|uniref:Uncharacterized protein n=1 Tax=mine drainage metagenome TaxID=410659 RepID=A0A1J5QYB1_9ZZZZ
MQQQHLQEDLRRALQVAAHALHQRFRPGLTAGQLADRRGVTPRLHAAEPADEPEQQQQHTERQRQAGAYRQKVHRAVPV